MGKDVRARYERECSSSSPMGGQAIEWVNTPCAACSQRFFNETSPASRTTIHLNHGRTDGCPVVFLNRLCHSKGMCRVLLLPSFPKREQPSLCRRRSSPWNCNINNFVPPSSAASSIIGVFTTTISDRRSRFARFRYAISDRSYQKESTRENI